MKRNGYIEGLHYELPHTFRVVSERLRDEFTEGAYVKDGIVRWQSNNSVPPKDVLEFWSHIGKSFDLELSNLMRDRESNEFIEAYQQQMRNHTLSQEELFEIRAAFGSGTTVINVLTGKAMII